MWLNTTAEVLREAYFLLCLFAGNANHKNKPMFKHNHVQLQSIQEMILTLAHHFRHGGAGSVLVGQHRRGLDLSSMPSTHGGVMPIPRKSR